MATSTNRAGAGGAVEAAGSSAHLAPSSLYAEYAAPVVTDPREWLRMAALTAFDPAIDDEVLCGLECFSLLSGEARETLRRVVALLSRRKHAIDELRAIHNVRRQVLSREHKYHRIGFGVQYSTSMSKREVEDIAFGSPLEALTRVFVCKECRDVYSVCKPECTSIPIPLPNAICRDCHPNIECKHLGVPDGKAIHRCRRIMNKVTAYHFGEAKISRAHCCDSLKCGRDLVCDHNPMYMCDAYGSGYGRVKCSKLVESDHAKCLKALKRVPTVMMVCYTHPDSHGEYNGLYRYTSTYRTKYIRHIVRQLRNQSKRAMKRLRKEVDDEAIFEQVEEFLQSEKIERPRNLLAVETPERTARLAHLAVLTKRISELVALNEIDPTDIRMPTNVKPGTDLGWSEVNTAFLEGLSVKVSVQRVPTDGPVRLASTDALEHVFIMDALHDPTLRGLVAEAVPSRNDKEWYRDDNELFALHGRRMGDFLLTIDGPTVTITPYRNANVIYLKTRGSNTRQVVIKMQDPRDSSTMMSCVVCGTGSTTLCCPCMTQFLGAESPFRRARNFAMCHGIRMLPALEASCEPVKECRSIHEALVTSPDVTRKRSPWTLEGNAKLTSEFANCAGCGKAIGSNWWGSNVGATNYHSTSRKMCAWKVLQTSTECATPDDLRREIFTNPRFDEMLATARALQSSGASSYAEFEKNMRAMAATPTYACSICGDIHGTHATCLTVFFVFDGEWTSVNFVYGPLPEDDSKASAALEALKKCIYRE